jgi:branched-subunit amino acid aminotransferase/4-amino-4-deoxychorismate lyase
MELNGDSVTLDQIKALALINYGHFTSMLVENGQVRGLSLHLERLARDCRRLFNAELDLDLVRSYIRRTLDAPRITVRVTVFDPALELGTIGAEANPHVLVTTRPAPVGIAAPVRLQAAAYRREIPKVKHIGLFGALERRRSAQRDGYGDVLFLNPDGTISEIATSNIGFVRGGEIVWPRSEYLAGITMTLLHQALDEAVVTEPLTLSDLPGMDAAFATNAATGVRSVISVDDVQWPAEHKAVRDLQELYADIPAERV